MQEQFEHALKQCVTISKSKIALVTKLSMKHIARYKDVVHFVEKFIRKGKTLHNSKLPQLFIIDSICRAAMSKHKHSQRFTNRFGRNIEKTFDALCRGNARKDRPTIKRVFMLWNEDEWFPMEQMSRIMMVINEFPDYSKKNNNHKIKDEQISDIEEEEDEDEDMDNNEQRMNVKIEIKVEDNNDLQSIQSLPNRKRLMPSLIQHGIQSMHDLPPNKRIKFDSNQNAMQMQMNMKYNLNNNPLRTYPSYPPPTFAVDVIPKLNNGQINNFGGWELDLDQSEMKEDRLRALSSTLYVGFWNNINVDMDRLRSECNAFGKVLKLLPHPSVIPHKHCFIQYASRKSAVLSKDNLTAKMSEMPFLQKIAWGRPPKLKDNYFNFSTGAGEVLKSELQHFMHNKHYSRSNPSSIPNSNPVSHVQNHSSFIQNTNNAHLLSQTLPTHMTPMNPMQVRNATHYPPPSQSPHEIHLNTNHHMFHEQMNNPYGQRMQPQMIQQAPHPQQHFNLRNQTSMRY